LTTGSPTHSKPSLTIHAPFTNEKLHSRMEAVMYAVREKLLDIP